MFEARDAAVETQREVAVPHHLGRAPREQHGDVERARRGDGVEGFHDGPDQEQARSDLQGGGGQRGPHDPRGRVQDLEHGERLRVFSEGGDGGVDVGCGDEGQEEERAGEDGEPEEGGEEVVREQVGGFAAARRR